MSSAYEHCTLCPRGCGVDRTRGELGFCGQGSRPRIAWAGLHSGEEPPLTAGGGSGTIFFSGCTLQCPFCQNRQISAQGLGREISEAALAELMLQLQARGAANINLVTAGHFRPSLLECLSRAKRSGLSIPVVWNSSGYESLSALEALNEQVDVFLPDCKTLDPALSRALLAAPDYPQIVREALPYMAAARPLVVEGGAIRSGLIVRHLVLPGYLEASRAVLEWFSRRLRDRALLSLMFQYTPADDEEAAAAAGAGPAAAVGRAGAARPEAAIPEAADAAVLRRRISRREYAQVLTWLEELGIEEGFVQEPAPNSDWLPDFERLNPFPDGQAAPVWHWRDTVKERRSGQRLSDSPG